MSAMEVTEDALNLNRDEQKHLVHFVGFFAAKDLEMFCQFIYRGFIFLSAQECYMTRCVKRDDTL